jgi:hypothetical protein
MNVHGDALREIWEHPGQDVELEYEVSERVALPVANAVAVARAGVGPELRPAALALGATALDCAKRLAAAEGLAVPSLAQLVALPNTGGGAWRETAPPVGAWADEVERQFAPLELVEERGIDDEYHRLLRIIGLSAELVAWLDSL